MSIARAELTAFFDELCLAAAKETLPRFRAGTEIDNKRPQDFDPVTEGDRQAEKAIRALIVENYPDHGVIGEEYEATNPDALYQWIIDPIDGTRAFISGLPVWGTLIGLYRDGKPFAGVMDQPFTQERYLGFSENQDSEPMGTYLSLKGEKYEAISASKKNSLFDATLMTTAPSLFAEDEIGRYSKLESSVKLARYGCDCYAYAMVAGGHVDLVVESGLHIYDIAALIPVIEGAGGIVTNWQGGDASKGGQILAAGNAALHAQALEILAG